ncbi:MAG: FIST C-terminal domain-containing protein [Synechococcales cyanobacterium T60_A2020_003]|nr:FIST C-terminal domain-containing protein [Synechococcales cyanobacterium T60_A2020_003]
MTDSMKWASALSQKPSLEAAVKEVAEQAQRSLQATADLAFVFISSSFTSEFPRLMPLLKEYLSVPYLIGCSGGGIIGQDVEIDEVQEVEDEPALCLTLAHLPGVNIHPFHTREDDLPDLDSPPDAWVELIGVRPEENPQFILLADPFTAGINDLLQGLDFAYPGSVKVGGLAGSDASSGNSSLFCNFEHLREGVVGVALSGNVVLEAIVAQGCRPIGQTYRVVDGERNIVMKVVPQDANPFASDGTALTPLEALQEVYQDLSDEDRELAQHSLFVGVAQSEFKQSLEQGDFLIRNLLGVDPKVGAIAIGDRVRAGQRIQFHLRDAETSSNDLDALLEKYVMNLDPNQASPSGALMFSCLGRGEGLYGEPNIDSQLLHQYLKRIPVSGFFCNGEIGPVGNTTFLHGYTSVFGICRASHED